MSYLCPSGHYCTGGNITGPSSVMVPQQCPEHTYYPGLEAQSLADCQPCPPGYRCPMPGKGPMLLLLKPDARSNPYMEKDEWVEAGGGGHGRCQGKLHEPWMVKGVGAYSSKPLFASSLFFSILFSTGLTTFEDYPCPPGHWCPGEGDTFLCPPGTFRTQPGAVSLDECDPCSPGYYCPDPAQTKMPNIQGTPCEPGYECPPGEEFMPFGSLSCSAVCQHPCNAIQHPVGSDRRWQWWLCCEPQGLWSLWGTWQ